jgi:hypothetical protein
MGKACTVDSKHEAFIINFKLRKNLHSGKKKERKTEYLIKKLIKYFVFLFSLSLFSPSSYFTKSKRENEEEKNLNF